MRTIERSGAFKRDFKRIKRSGQHISAIKETLPAIIESLAADQPLPPRHRDHRLSGDWSGFRECHVKPDLLLIYKQWTADGEPPVALLSLARLGSHSDLFE